MQLLGTLHGEVTPTEFSILLSNYSTGRGTYVKINHEEYGWVLARVSDIKRYINNKGEETVIAKAYTVGYKQDGIVKIPKIPFRPSERVYSADGELIMGILGLKKSKADNIYIGLLDGCNIPVYLDLNKTIGKHVSVLAMTGAGKSYTVGVILEELLKNDVPVVIIDPHGEYSSLRYENDDYDAMLLYGVKPRSYAKEITEYTTNIITNSNARKLTLRSRFALEELSEIMPVKLGDKQKLILYNALRRLEHQEYTMQDLINAVRLERGREKWKVINALEALRNSGIFEGKPIAEKEIVKNGHVSIIDLKGAEPQIQQLVVAKISKDLFNSIKLGHIQPFFFLIEEAHNFCPERGFGDTLSSQIIRTIASEGRKFGLHLCVVSQRPARVDKNVISQCNTQIILKVTNPNDLRAIGQSIEGFTSGMENEIKQLSIGQALIVGECVEQPITVNIRARETRHVSAVGAKGKGVEIPKISRKSRVIEKIRPVFVKNKKTEIQEDAEIKEEKELEGKPKKDKQEKRKRSHLDKIVSMFLKEK